MDLCNYAKKNKLIILLYEDKRIDYSIQNYKVHYTLEKRFNNDKITFNYYDGINTDIYNAYYIDIKDETKYENVLEYIFSNNNSRTALDKDCVKYLHIIDKLSKKYNKSVNLTINFDKNEFYLDITYNIFEGKFNVIIIVHKIKYLNLPFSPSIDSDECCDQ